MSWQMLDGPSRRPRVSWAIPEHLRENPRYGPFRRPLVPAALDPDILLQYMDNAISITENSQATKYLSLLFASSSSSSTPTSSSSVSHTIRQHDDGSSTMPPLPSARKVSRFKSAAPYVSSMLRPNDHGEAIPASRPNLPAISETMDALALEEQESTKISTLSQKTESEEFSEAEGVSKGDDKSDRREEYDARAADDAYRTACCAFSEGNAELALSLLHLASAKCPPDKHTALGKVHRLMEAAMQLLEKRSAVLSPLPVDKDAQ